MKNKKTNDSTSNLITMTPEDAGKVLGKECMKEKPDVELIKNLLEHTQVNVNWQDKEGQSALHYASGWGHTEIVQMLLERPEIDVNLQNEDGSTALMRVACWGLPDMVKVLLGHPNIDIEIEDWDGMTALDCASSMSSEVEIEIMEEIWELLETH